VPGAARKYLDTPASPATLAAYASDWREWERWCRFHGYRAGAPARGLLVEHLAQLADAGRAAATLRRRAAGVRFGLAARAAAAPDTPPEIAALLAGVARRRREEPAALVPRRARPLLADDMGRIADALAEARRPVDSRDAALLLLGWCGAMRRAEIAGLEWRDIQFEARGLVLLVRRAKRRTEGEVLYIPRGGLATRCPVVSLAAWRARLAPGQTGGRAPLFRRATRGGGIAAGRLGAASVGAILRRRAALAGVEPDGLSAHSLRAGMLTSAAAAGSSRASLLQHARHRRGETLDLYIRPAAAWRSNPARGLL